MAPMLVFHHVTEKCDGMKVEVHSFFISILYAGQLSVVRPVSFTTGEPVTLWKGECLGHRAGLLQ